MPPVPNQDEPPEAPRDPAANAPGEAPGDGATADSSGTVNAPEADEYLKGPYRKGWEL